MKNEIRLSEFFRLWYIGGLTIANRQALINRRLGFSATVKQVKHACVNTAAHCHGGWAY